MNEAEFQYGFFINRQYLYDLSVENLVGEIVPQDMPVLKQGLEGSVQAHAVEQADAASAPADFNVDITIKLSAAINDRVVFIIELTYRVEVTPSSIPDFALPQMLCVAVPTNVFASIKQILQQNAAYAGYPDLYVADFDFNAMYYAQHAVPDFDKLRVN